MVEFSYRKQLALSDEQIVDSFNDAQDGILDLVRNLNLSAIIKGSLFTSISLSTTASLIRHGFGYEARGFIVVDKTASVDVYRDTSATNPDSRQFIALRTASGSATVSLWIF